MYRWQGLSNEEIWKILDEVYAAPDDEDKSKQGSLHETPSHHAARAGRRNSSVSWSADSVVAFAEARAHTIRTLFQSEALEWEPELTPTNTASLVRTYVLHDEDPLLLADDAPPDGPQGFLVRSSAFDAFLVWHSNELGRPMFLSPDLLALNLTTHKCLLGHHSGLILLIEPACAGSKDK